MNNFIVYDTEIVNAIPVPSEPKIVGINYCGGWTDYSGMGISTLCAYDARTKRTRVFLKDNLKEFQKLVDEVDFVIGFNNINFDDPLCAAHGINIPKEKSRDVKRLVQEAAGFKVNARVKGFKLQNICEANGLPLKTEDGALAPIMWQQGQFGRVIDYCLNDILMTVDLLRKMYTGKMVNPVTRVDMNIDISELFNSKVS